MGHRMRPRKVVSFDTWGPDELVLRTRRRRVVPVNACGRDLREAIKGRPQPFRLLGA